MSIAEAAGISARTSDRSAQGMSLSQERFLHIPTPGDHYSFTTGSAIMTLVYELARKHADAGGQTTIVVGRGTRHDYPVGECVEVDFAGLPSGWRKAADVALGRIGLPRAMANAAYAPAKAAIDTDFDGHIFLQNAPAPIKMIKSHAPFARVHLHAHNTLFKTYSDREIVETVAAADLILCNCEFLANEITPRLGGRNSSKIRIFHNGVDTARFVPKPELRNPEIVNILFVARMVPEKGADLLIKAAHKIATKRPFKLTIVGNQGFSASDPLSPYEIELRKIAAPLGGKVEFVPFVDRNRILPIYQAADIFCAPSNWNEPCTLTIPEAMGCGAPTVTSRRGGIPEIAGDAVLYFDPPNTDQLAEQLTYLIDDENARREWGVSARTRAESLDWRIRYGVLRHVLKS